MKLLLAGCTWKGLDAWSDDFEAYADMDDLVADDGDDGWTEQITRDANTIALTGEQAHSGVQAVVWNAEGWPRLRQGGHHPAVEVDVPTASVLPASPACPHAPTGSPADELSWP